ncbi:MAG: helix-turn-helix domain-containing protein [Duncaniella sp.]|nr:helix-turn-helix domain-containing protein [Duncaniella sp.]
MRNITAIFIILLSALDALGQAYCTVTTYDEDSGLSQRLVKGIVQDNAGFIWIATWNGLNRFDGSEFATLRPDFNDEAYRYSNRIGDLHLSPRGNLLCRIDDRISLFDVNTFKYTDLHSQIESAIGKRFDLKQILPARGEEIVMSTKDGHYIIIPSEDSIPAAKIVDTRPDISYRRRGNRLHTPIGPYRPEDLVFSRVDSCGTTWLITREGEIMSTSGDYDHFTLHERIDMVPGSLYFSTTDKSGNVWLRSSEGAHHITLGHRPYSTVKTCHDSKMRTSMRDSAGKIWLSESDGNAVSLLDVASGSKKYLDHSGKLSDSFSTFGSPVYAMSQSPDGTVWLGSKPDGAYRLTPAGDNGYEMEHFDTGNVYDFRFDNHGALWIATMGDGVLYCPDPAARNPHFTRLKEKEGYPDEARLVRHLAISGDTMMLASTTSGLLAVDMRTVDKSDAVRASLLTSRPGDASSLGNIAVMDVTVGRDGTILVATESDGINIVVPSAIDKPENWKFYHHNASSGLTDIALAVVEAPQNLDGWYLVTSNNRLYLFNPSTGRKMVYGDWFWGRKLRFTDGRPVMAADGSWVIGHENGAVIMKPDTAMNIPTITPVMFTAASIQGQKERLLSAETDSIVLGKRERNLTVKFSALDLNGSDDIEYSVKLGDDDWVNLGKQNSLTLLDLTPGEYNLSVRATSPAGSILDREDNLVIIVTPTFWETTLAKVLYAMVALLFAGACIWIIVYIRAMKRKQREILNAYLSAIKTAPADMQALEGEETIEATPASDVENLPLSDEDKALMESVTAFVAENIADPSVTVDDMAAAVAISRSSLNRKMKSLMGVSPAEFIRESRLSQAEKMLTETDRSIKEIAYDCGFADINYFGKCFKASRGVPPGAYRKSELK